ncbi:MAG: 3-deoxy-7-phosphoheptulonate synthase [Pseudomonadota bacterium]|nr:3-deoxy-7-phosphoheptulonate synthase [Pseudomonadota bacterium]
MQETYKKQQERHIISINGTDIIGRDLCLMAGPCSIESEEQITKIANYVSGLGIKVIRGGAYKPRTSPYSFQGLGEQGFIFLNKAARQHNLFSISEVVDQASLDCALDYIDIIQIGSRNMQNFSLLQAAGTSNKPVMLKRGAAATYKEFLLAAEYILNAGNPNVILCERGIRTFETYTRNTLDLAAVPILHELSHLPVVVDPSHGTGLAQFVKPMSIAASAIGADGIMIETHYEPENSISDSKQTVSELELQDIINSINYKR